jgi:uncharacterized membrane protein
VEFEPTMRPLYMGLLFFLIGVIGYLSVNVYFSTMSLEMALIYSFAAIAISSLPIAAVLEIVRWRKDREDNDDQKKQKSPKP